ncbi:RNA 2'-phosphotransferase [Flavobacterium sp. RHBU_3]|uniref:RNA 2'-phosphotransferase n=1 Tax=Flavobacterium sp. RHBU_3 TaxID=3391184 RepID=UPI00398501A1
MNEKHIKHISKFLSLILRHAPETIGITLDENGWTDVDTLLAQMNLKGEAINREILNVVVDTNNKKRFAFNEDGSKIRASQGHSVDIDPGYVPQQPPELLYHGTALKHKDSILEKGILKQNRTHVHLSATTDTAHNVGSRHGKPYIFEVKAGEMHRNGYNFFISENGVWLTDEVPAEFLVK